MQYVWGVRGMPEKGAVQLKHNERTKCNILAHDQRLQVSNHASVKHDPDGHRSNHHSILNLASARCLMWSPAETDHQHHNLCAGTSNSTPSRTTLSSAKTFCPLEPSNGPPAQRARRRSVRAHLEQPA